MQGIKVLVPKMMYQVHIDRLVPQNNFYRLLDKELDLHFFYKATARYYGEEGQESIDPVVFFKICLVGYLNKLIPTVSLSSIAATVWIFVCS